MKLLFSTIFIVALTSVFAESSLYPFETNGLIGYMTQTGYIRIKEKYEEGGPFVNGFANVGFKNGEIGFINLNGDIIVKKTNITNITSFSDGYLAFSEKNEMRNLYGFMDETGKVIIPCQFEAAGPFVNGKAVVKKSGKWGIINKQGKFLLPATFFRMGKCFSEGLLQVQRTSDSPWEYINEKFERVFSLDKSVKVVGSFYNNRAIIVKNGLYGYIDTKGMEKIPCKYLYAWRFSENLAAVSSENGSGYIDKYGKIVIPFNYSNALPFNEGYAAIRINHLWGFVDKTGKIVISPQYDEASNFMKGLAFVVSDAFCGYIDKNGKQIIPRQK